MNDNRSKAETEKGVVSIIGYLNDIPGLAAAYLFGSAAGGNVSQHSDIDVGLLFLETTAGHPDRLDLMTELSRTAGRDVDVIIINEASPMMYHEILSTGRLLLEKNRLFRIRREVQNRRNYADYCHLHSIYMRAMRKRYG